MIGERVRFYRISRKLTLAELARLSGLGKGHISDIENGKRKNVGIETVLKLTDALGVNIQDLARDKTVGELEKYA